MPHNAASFSFSVTICRFVSSVMTSCTDGRMAREMSQYDPPLVVAQPLTVTAIEISRPKTIDFIFDLPCLFE